MQSSIQQLDLFGYYCAASCVAACVCPSGAHILSGNVFEPRAFNELFPDWKEKRDKGEAFTDLPLTQQVTADRFYMLTKGSSIRLPNPPQMNNKRKNYVISLRWVVCMHSSRTHAAAPVAPLSSHLGCCQCTHASRRTLPRHCQSNCRVCMLQGPLQCAVGRVRLCDSFPLLPACVPPPCSELTRWMAKHAEEEGVDIFPGFAGECSVVHCAAVCTVLCYTMVCADSAQPSQGQQAV